MKIDNFLLERYFAKYEFKTKYLFSSSDCDGFSLDYVLKQATSVERETWDQLTLGYTESEGNILLREAIASLYETIDAEEILVSSPGEANFILMNILIEEGDHVVCMGPAYQSLYQVARSLGAKLSFWQPDEKNWHYDPDELDDLVTHETKLIIINFPHNPTGAFPSIVEFERIVEIADKNNVHLFSDEMYRLLNHSTDHNIPAACDVYEKGISLWGMAKTFGLAGLRIGWLATHDKQILLRSQAFKDYLTICNSAPSEILAMIAINHKDEFIGPNLEKIRTNIDLFSKFCKNATDLFHFIPPVAGSTGFCQVLTQGRASQICENLLDSTGIMVVPSTMFEYGDQHIRIGFGRENFLEMLDLLKIYLKGTHRKS